ncbi:MAG: 50S ribosomal protein L35ae [Candidatus Diapherotrites archaeon]|nr:50S ribosomal protein L35ae [Candidatus Diapherotrites archaeon]
MAKGLVISYRRGRRTMRTNQVIIEVPGVSNRKEAARLIGKKVLWITPGGKKLKGIITAPHGNRGRVRARFTKGVPGQMIGQKVEIL